MIALSGRLSLAALVVAGVLVPNGRAQTAAPVRFQEHVIEANIPGGYRALVVDLNGDHKPDVIGLSNRATELYWYENPSWKRHLLIDGMHRMITVAAADIDNDGVPEIVLATHFGQTESQSEGRLLLVRHQGDPGRPWQAKEFDRLATSHRVQFADIDGDGKKELINSPLTGPGARAPLFECRTPLVYYRPGEWKRRVIYEDLDGVVHGMRALPWDDSGRHAILTASFGGIWLHQSTGGQPLEWEHRPLMVGDPSARPAGGASEIRVGRLGTRRFLASVEPWHGQQVVIYTPASGDSWERQVLDASLEDGHALETADFNGDGLDEIVAGFRGKVATLYLYSAQDGQGKRWQRHVVDSGGMAAAGCDVEDLNQDGRLDVVCVGSRTANLKWYENLGPE